MRSVGSYFSEKMRNSKSVFGSSRLVRIACEPIPWSAQGDLEIEQKKGHLSEPLFFTKNIEHIPKKTSQRSPNGWLYFPGGASWAALGHFWCHKLFYDTQKEPTATPKCPQGLKNTSEMNPKVQKMTLKVPPESEVTGDFWTGARIVNKNEWTNEDSFGTNIIWLKMKNWFLTKVARNWCKNASKSSKFSQDLWIRGSICDHL